MSPVFRRPVSRSDRPVQRSRLIHFQPPAVAPGTAAEQGRDRDVVDRIVNPAGLGLPADDISQDRPEHRVASGEVQRPVHRVDHPDRCVAQQRVQRRRLARNQFLTDHQRFRIRLQQQPAQHLLRLDIGDGDGIVRSLLGDLARRQIAEPGQDLRFHGGADQTADVVHIDHHGNFQVKVRAKSR